MLLLSIGVWVIVVVLILILFQLKGIFGLLEVALAHWWGIDVEDVENLDVKAVEKFLEDNPTGPPQGMDLDPKAALKAMQKLKKDK